MMWPRFYLPTMYKYSDICKITGRVLREVKVTTKYHWANKVGDIWINRHDSYKYDTRYEGEASHG